MRYCSFVVWAPGTVELPEHLLIIERGMNAFSILVEDVAGFNRIRAAFEDADTAAALARLRESPVVEYEQVAALNGPRSSATSMARRSPRPWMQSPPAN